MVATAVLICTSLLHHRPLPKVLNDSLASLSVVADARLENLVHEETCRVAMRFTGPTPDQCRNIQSSCDGRCSRTKKTLEQLVFDVAEVGSDHLHHIQRCGSELMATATPPG